MRPFRVTSASGHPASMRQSSSWALWPASPIPEQKRKIIGRQFVEVFPGRSH